MGKETKESIINAAKDVVLEIIVLVADKISQEVRTMRTKEVRFAGDFDGDMPDPNKATLDPNAR